MKLTAQMEIDRDIVNGGVTNTPLEASLLFYQLCRRTDGAVVDAHACAQIIIPTDIKQVAGMGFIDFAVWKCADRIFMLKDRCYRSNGAILRNYEKSLFGDKGLVAHFIRRYAKHLGYAVEDIDDTSFCLVDCGGITVEQCDLLELKALQADAELYPAPKVMLEMLRTYMAEAHELLYHPKTGDAECTLRSHNASMR